MQRKIELYSFGYGRSGPPPGDAVVFDCRKLPNPHNDTALRWMDGRDMEVRDFVLKSPKAHAIITSATVDALQHGKVAFGCYGGRHRSVAIAEIVADRLRDDGLEVEVVHLDLR